METTTIEDQLKSAGEFGRHDIYAGDDAWREWFDVCFVDGCSAAKALREQVASAMYAQLVRFGFARADVDDSDPVLHFDAYFMLTGSRRRPHPLHRPGLDRHREGMETAFGAGHGRAPSPRVGTRS